MRSVVGALPIALGLLIIAGCALPARNDAGNGLYGLSPKGRSKSKSTADTDDGKLTFKPPQKKTRPKADDLDQLMADASDKSADDTAKSKKSSKPNSASQTATASVSSTTSTNSAGTKSDSKSSVIRQVKDEWEDATESPIQKNPVQLGQLEVDADDTPASSQSASNATTKQEPLAEAQLTGVLPMWSDRPTDNRSGSGSTTTAGTNGRVNQVNAVSGAAGTTTQTFPGPVIPPPWQPDLNQLISQVEQQLAQLTGNGKTEEAAERSRLETQLRLLYLVAQRQEEALTAIPGMNSAQQEYWQQMIWALFNSLDTAQFPEPKDRAAQTLAPLSSALRHVREEAPLNIRNMAFCKKISGFGNYERFPRNEFPPGYEVLLYTEIENFVSSPTAEGEFRTSLRTTIEIMDASGRMVWSKRFATPTEDFCRNPRRDYFQNCHFHIPEDLPTGEYSLSLTIADEIGGKQARSTLKFLLK